MNRDERIRDADDAASNGEQTYWEGKTYEILELLDQLDTIQLNIISNAVEKILDQRVEDYAKELPF